MYNLIKVKFKFLGNKKDQQKVFIWKFEKLTQYFLLSLSFELSKMCLFLKLNVWRYGLLRVLRGTTYIKKECDVE